jgi:hypothetical protein
LPFVLRRSLVATTLLLGACNADKPTSSSTPVVVKPGITWPASADTRGPTLLGDDNAKLVARSPVPVLVPDTRVDQPVLIVEAKYYAFSGKLPGGVSLAIQGTRDAYRYDNIAPAKGDKTLRGVGGFVTINEGIRVATWNENGAAYSVDVECASHDDERCAKEDFVVALTNRLVYVGGSGR